MSIAPLLNEHNCIIGEDARSMGDMAVHRYWCPERSGHLMESSQLSATSDSCLKKQSEWKNAPFGLHLDFDECHFDEALLLSPGVVIL